MAQVLVVEDDASVRTLVESLLGCDGFDFLAVRNVEEAAAALLNFEGFDVIIADFYLQQATASPLLDLMSGRYPATPVILMSGGNELIPIEAVYAIGAVSGAISFLQKPVLRSQLLEAVNQALGGQ